jgi:hypothetical protein
MLKLTTFTAVGKDFFYFGFASAITELINLIRGSD